MTGGRGVRLALLTIVGLGFALVMWTARRPAPAAIVTSGTGAPTKTAPTPSAAVPDNSAPEIDPAFGGTSQIAQALNADGGTIQRDLQILEEVFESWQSNFPRLGNPVGENTDITAALSGANELKFSFIAPRHRAINGEGELCDRWGTPFRFHQLSGKHMEIRSAGPDRKFATEDDALLTPAY